MKKILFVIAIFLTAGNAVLFSGTAEEFRSLSLVALLSDPGKWDGESIVTSGFLVSSNRGRMIFLGEDDAKNLLIENAIAVVPSGNSVNIESSLQELAGGYVRIRAIFKKYDPSRVIEAPLKGCLLAVEVVRPDGR
ncbi:MAG: hypothetical protein BGO12_22680 [Verrucomicrobia bacterium 61-8]|nr:MAG: hypothetical protein BGO12_22680 [Verrucomicrobia bacterium 61-8]